MAAKSAAFSGWVTLGIAGLLYAMMQIEKVSSMTTGWLALMIVVSLVRIGASRYWRRLRATSEGATPAFVERWENYHAVLALSCGLAWAALVYFTVVDAERVTLLVGFALTVALVLAGTSQVPSRGADLLFAIPIVIAQIVNVHRLGSLHESLFAIAWIVLVLVLYVTPRLSSTSLREALLARIVHERRAVEQTALFDTAPLGILVVRDARIVVCNEAMRRLLGYDRTSDLIGKDVRVIIPDGEPWKEAMHDRDRALAGLAAPRIVKRLRRDGSTVDLMRNIAALRTSAGETEFIGTYEDVKDRVAIEEGYRHALRMQRLVFEAAGEGIAIVNDGIVEQANQALSDLLGTPIARLTGRPLQTIFEDPHEWTEIEKRFQRLGNLLKIERRVLRSDGRATWANVTGCLVDAPVESDGSAGDAETTTGQRSIWILADLSVQKQKEAENWHHANHDVMTGLPNRRFLQDRLDQALAFARRDGRRVAVLEVDLDGFKSVNDNYGHRFGDAVLEEVARRLSAVVRELDTVGRWGGDEFVLVLKEIESREVVEEMVKRVIARLSDPIVYMGQNLSIGASIGIAMYPDHGEEVEMLMLAADLAMYESKSSGGNTWRFSSPTSLVPRGKYRPSSPAQAPVENS